MRYPLRRLTCALVLLAALGTGVAAQQSNVTNAVVIAALQAMGLFGDGYAVGQAPVWSASAGQFQPGAPAPGFPLLAPNGTAVAPSYSFASDPNTGWYRPAEGHIGYTSNGTEYFRFEGDTLQLRSTNILSWSSGVISPGAGDVSLSRGAANRLDLATGDSFYLVSGGLGVGTPPVGANRIDLPNNGAVILGQFGVVQVGAGGNFSFGVGTTFQGPGDGTLVITNGAQTIGVGLDVTIDGLLKVRNRALNAAGGLGFASLAISGTAPTIASGFCTSPAVSASNGTAAFAITIGTGCAASTGTVTMPAATTGWACHIVNVTTPATNNPKQTGGTTTTVTVTNYAMTTGVAANFTASESLRFHCTGY
jgi:hypothetical protein